MKQSDGSSMIKRRQFLIGAMGAGVSLGVMSLSGCSLISGTSQQNAGPTGAFPTKWSKPITVTVFDDLANYQGLQTGWFAALVQKKFNIKLNVIAPNVAGGGETLFNTRSAAGDLGDLVVLGSAQHLTQAAKGGLLYDASSFYKNMSSAKKYDAAVAFTNQGMKGKVAFPSSVSSRKPSQPSEGADPTFGPYVRWDLYGKVGYPQVNTLEDLLPVFQEMQKAAPKAPNGKPTYAFSLFKDWDGNMMTAAKQPACYYGFDEMGFVLAAADGSSYESLIDSGSHYVRALRFFHKGSQLGLMDPDSPTQNFSTQNAKFQNGQVLYCFWPWVCKPAYNTDANMNAGRGFEMLDLKDAKIFSYGAQPLGSSSNSIGIGVKAQDPQRMAAFIDWLYSAEGVYANGSQTGSAPGPKGLTWELPKKGDPELTAFGKNAMLGGSTQQVPSGWGTGTYAKGVSALNVTLVTAVDEDPATGQPFLVTEWPSYLKETSNALTQDWSGRMGGAKTTIDYLQSHGQLSVGAGSGYVAPQDTAEIQTLRNQIKSVIVQASWRMAMATSDADFESQLKDMQSTAKGLGYEKVLAVDMEHAKAQNDARVAIVKKFG
ncbi:ABC transporter substrate-binding protein [Amnibacterium sp.]|uniref:ABC transporter substrate-binding protein n=1 Tax=Amnibacterium sp. TaxID=1872496 RepID=UPI003F7C9217